MKEDGNVLFSIKINGQILVKAINTKPKSSKDVKVYVGWGANTIGPNKMGKLENLVAYLS